MMSRIALRSPFRRLAVAAFCFGLATSVAQAEDAALRTKPTMRLAVRSATKAEPPRPIAQTSGRPLYSASAYTCTPSGFGRLARCVQRGG